MRTRWSRLLPLLIAALWLPLHAIAATTMPLAALAGLGSMPADHHGVMAQVADADMSQHPCHGMAKSSTTQPSSHSTSQPAKGCLSSCGVCHLASAGVLLGTAMTSEALPPIHDYAVQAIAHHGDHIPELPARPPRAAA